MYLTSKNLMNIPQQFHHFLDQTFIFRIVDCYPAIEVEGTNNFWTRVPKFYQGKSHTINQIVLHRFPLSIYFKILSSDGKDVEYILISEEKYPELFLSGKLFNEARLSGTRFPKYMTLFKAYETLTKPRDRNLVYSATRHSISHTTTQLTRPDVVNTLQKQYGSLEIDLSKFRHKKSFYVNLWNLLIETDKLITSSIMKISGEAEYLYPNLKIIK